MTGRAGSAFAAARMVKETPDSTGVSDERAILSFGLLISGITAVFFFSLQLAEASPMIAGLFSYLAQ